ncbi:Trm112 family protein [Flagellatimonas centrodinii]|uniref:Trm112 family protein n=1 Tax=Flagellatimonas centrodinii TaxID=2806210 RepID=UPI001FEFA851|nr:Trm112 family protein [Flagellatimonas centrodinii]ULQ47015.1 Trm112 family protein [Flagellatimonas centrodinii]
MLDKRLLDLLVCPVTKGPLVWRPEVQELWCRSSRLAYPVRDGVPVMIEDEARTLSDSELDQLR